MQRSLSEQGAKQMFAFFGADISSTLKPEYCFPERKQTCSRTESPIIDRNIHTHLVAGAKRQAKMNARFLERLAYFTEEIKAMLFKEHHLIIFFLSATLCSFSSFVIQCSYSGWMFKCVHNTKQMFQCYWL